MPPRWGWEGIFWQLAGYKHVIPKEARKNNCHILGEMV
jgi:hypothetical protein